MGAPSTPGRTQQQKALELEQQRQLSDLTGEENRRAKALMRGRIGMRQLLGPMGPLGSESPLGPVVAPPVGKPPGADSGYRPPPPPGKGPRRRGTSMVGFGGTGPAGAGGMPRQRMAS